MVAPRLIQPEQVALAALPPAEAAPCLLSEPPQPIPPVAGRPPACRLPKNPGQAAPRRRPAWPGFFPRTPSAVVFPTAATTVCTPAPYAEVTVALSWHQTSLESLEVGATPLGRSFLQRLHLPQLFERHLPTVPGRQPTLPSAVTLGVLLTNPLLARQPL